jgi:hypothetical protein
MRVVIEIISFNFSVCKWLCIILVIVVVCQCDDVFLCLFSSSIFFFMVDSGLVPWYLVFFFANTGEDTLFEID